MGMRRDLRPAGFLSARGNRSSAWAHTRNQPRACETGQRNKHGARLARRRRAAGRLSGPSGRKPPAGRETPEKPRSRAQLFGRFCAWGYVRPHVLRIHGSLARAFARRVSSRAQGTGAKLFPCPGKQKPCPGPALGTNRVRARRRERKDRVRELPGAAARACETRGRSRQGEPLCRQPTHYRQQRG